MKELFTRTGIKTVAGFLILACFLCPTTASSQWNANDVCATSFLLTSGTTCTPSNGSLRNGAAQATMTGGMAALCGNANSPDVWYRFVAQTPYPVITMSNMGTLMDDNPRMVLFNTGTCTPTAAAALACASGTNVVAPQTLSIDVGTAVGGVGLTVGNTYLIRVFLNAASSAGGIPANWDFKICVTDPVTPPPANDDCSGAVTLPVAPSCGSGSQFSIAGATASAPATVCAGFPVAYDVWFKFTAATSASHTISLSGFGANFLATRRMELFSGTCAGLTSIGCSASPFASPALVAGNTYYVRVYSTTGPPPNANAGFSICIAATSATIPPRFGNSYVNLSKKTSGGVVQTGDTLEIRTTIHYQGSATLFKARYVDNVPTKTAMLITTADSIRVVTNEGLTFRRYTPVATADAATYIAAPPAGQHQIKMNLGFSIAPGVPLNNTEADVTGAVDILNTDKPRGNGGGVLFATAFRVVVTGNPGDTIKFGVGKFIYRTTVGGADIAITSIPYQIMISNPMTLCASSIGVNNAQESGGTFGGGFTLNRPTDLVSPIAGYTLIQQTPTQGIGDGQYGIVKNMSPRNGVQKTANRQPTCGAPPPAFDCNNRMHGGYWDIDGDHTGTANAIGNPPPIAGDSAGYMLVVNADYVVSEAYRQTVTGLCPSTYYEFSAWMRNICGVCGADSTPAQTNKPGVYPNLTFTVNGLDRYNTGQIDTFGWVKKGFVFLTDTTANPTLTFTIRNNSQGGGGNDWAMDDIAVATCLPNMTYSPSNNPVVCQFNARAIRDTIRSYFNNYVYYKWQRSTDGGLTYFDISLVLGPATPFFNATLGVWEYVTSYNVPPIWTTPANNNDKYRVIAATTVGNIGSANCVITDGINFLTLNVLNCGTPLKTDLLSFNGKLSGDRASLTWTTSKEEEAIKYNIEKSTDGVSFLQIGSLDGYNDPNKTSNQYSFIDPTALSGKAYYRIQAVALNNSMKYSRTIELSLTGGHSFALANVVNPFNQTLDFDINSPVDVKIDAELLDMFGKVVKRKSYFIHSGLSQLNITDTEVLPTGTYILRVRNNEQVLSRKVLKKSL